MNPVILTDRTVLAWDGDQLMEASMFEDLPNLPLLAGVLFSGFGVGALVASGWVSFLWIKRHLRLRNEIAQREQLIEKLMIQIEKMARTPIDLNGSAEAHRQMQERV